MDQKWIISISEFVSIFSLNIALVLGQSFIYYIITLINTSQLFSVRPSNANVNLLLWAEILAP